MKVRKLIDTCNAFPKTIKIMVYIGKLARYEDIWRGGSQDEIPTDLLKSQVGTWDLYTEIVKDRDCVGEVIGEKVEVELRIYLSGDEL